MTLVPSAPSAALDLGEPIERLALELEVDLGRHRHVRRDEARQPQRVHHGTSASWARAIATPHCRAPSEVSEKSVPTSTRWIIDYLLR